MSSGAAARAATLGERAWAGVEKVNAELLLLTYGALVASLLKEGGAPEEVKEQTKGNKNKNKAKKHTSKRKPLFRFGEKKENHSVCA